MKIRKLLRILHRDLGYFIVGMTLVYALSGIYLNHRNDFNPDYQVKWYDIWINLPEKNSFSDDEIKTAIKALDDKLVYKKHFMTSQGNLKVFIENGDLEVNPSTGEGTLHQLSRRPLIFAINRLHRANIVVAWKWVSDIMAGIMIFVAVSGLFLLKGKRGLTRWGWWLTVSGIVVPLVFALLFI